MPFTKHWSVGSETTVRHISETYLAKLGRQ